MDARSLRGKVAIAGIGETAYYKHGRAPDPEFVLALKAILAACEDAGIDPRDIDGFASYSNDRNDPSRIAAALGIKELRFANMQWGGGGGGGAAAVGNAAAAVACGMGVLTVCGSGFCMARPPPPCWVEAQLLEHLRRHFLGHGIGDGCHRRRGVLRAPCCCRRRPPRNGPINRYSKLE